MGDIPLCRVHAVKMMMMMRRRMGEVCERTERIGKEVVGKKNKELVGVVRIDGSVKEQRKRRKACGNANVNTDKKDSPRLVEGNYVRWGEEQKLRLRLRLTSGWMSKPKPKPTLKPTLKLKSTWGLW